MKKALIGLQFRRLEKPLDLQAHLIIKSIDITWLIDFRAVCTRLGLDLFLKSFNMDGWPWEITVYLHNCERFSRCFVASFKFLPQTERCMLNCSAYKTKLDHLMLYKMKIKGKYYLGLLIAVCMCRRYFRFPL